MHRDERVTDAMVQALRDELKTFKPDDVLRAALSAALSEQTTPTTNCCICGRIIDTREKKYGGDDFGAETATGKWTCSIECCDAVTGYVPDVSEPVGYQQLKDGKWVECSHFVAFGWSDRLDKDCRPIYTHPPINTDVVDLSEVIAEIKNYGEDAQPGSEYRLACDDLVEHFSSRVGSATTSNGGDHARSRCP